MLTLQHRLISNMSEYTKKCAGIQEPKLTPTKKSNRNSSVEILRILAMLMIILSHTFATNSGEEYSGLSQVVFVFVESIFHSSLGVIIFMLISGYYLIRCSLKKVTNYIAMCWICAIVSLIIKVIAYPVLGETLSKTAMLKHLVPITSRYYWFISCYFCLLILSPFINTIIKKLERKEFTALIATICAVFFILPTVAYFDIMNDKGKGLVTMISSYLVGAYLSKYKINFSKKKLTITGIIVVIITFAGNMLATLVRGETSYPFSRECSILTLLLGVILLLLATSNSFSNKAINSLSTKSLYVYIIGCSVTGCIVKTNINDLLPNVYISLAFFCALSIALYLVIYLISIPLQFISNVLGSTLYLCINKFKEILLKNKRIKGIYEGINC